MTKTGTVEHLGADYFQDPHSVHARLRAQRPVSAVVMPGGWPAWPGAGGTGTARSPSWPVPRASCTTCR